MDKDLRVLAEVTAEASSFQLSVSAAISTLTLRLAAWRSTCPVSLVTRYRDVRTFAHRP